jgi:uncharacterized protein YjiS (DUF1127 family)
MSVLTSELSGRGAGKTLAGLVREAYRAYRSRRERLLAEHELAELDDYLLKDMGISRSDILSVVVHGRNARISANVEPFR